MERSRLLSRSTGLITLTVSVSIVLMVLFGLI